MAIQRGKEKTGMAERFKTRIKDNIPRENLVRAKWGAWVWRTSIVHPQNIQVFPALKLHVTIKPNKTLPFPFQKCQMDHWCITCAEKFPLLSFPLHSREIYYPLWSTCHLVIMPIYSPLSEFSFVDNPSLMSIQWSSEIFLLK